MSRVRSTGVRTSSIRTLPIKNYYSNVVLIDGKWTPTTRVDSVSISRTTWFDDRQSIVDVVGARNAYNPCTHTKHINYAVSFPAGVNVKYDARPIGVHGYNTWELDGVSIQSPDYSNISIQNIPPLGGTDLTTPAIADADWSSLVDQVGNQLDGRMTTGQNMIVSLAQVAQTVGMFKNPFNVRKLAGVRGSDLSLRKIMKIPANAYLEYSFGWLNVKRDFEAISKVWSEVRAHQEYLRKTGSLFTPLSSRQTSKASGPFQSLPSFQTDARYKLQPRITEIATTYCFSLDVKRERQAQLWSTFDQVVSRLGGRDLAEALWDLVPYSFVVDWFTHVNRFVTQSPISWNSYDIRHMGYSSKTEHTVDMNLSSYVSIPNRGVTSFSCDLGTKCVQKKYVRIAGFPPLCSSVGLFGNLNKTQIAQGISLIVQRL